MWEFNVKWTQMKTLNRFNAELIYLTADLKQA